MRRFNRAQSTLEYVIILAAVIGAIIYVASTLLKPKLQSSYDTLTTKMQDKVSSVNFSGE
ncbi:MAG: hypothetical protein WC315_09470 [Candidatus Omnitrophota bacterium]|jgi:hypothetical protein